MTETKDPIDNLSYVADEAKKAVDPDLESAVNSSLEPSHHDTVTEKRILRKVDIWRKAI